jgi:hypothetical protein
LEFQKKTLRHDLNQLPTNTRVGDRAFVNVAALQLGEEVD